MRTTTVEISIGQTTIRIQAPVDAPVIVNGSTTAQNETIVHERKPRKPRASGYTIPDRAPDHCSQCGAEGRRCNHDLGGCVECR